MELDDEVRTFADLLKQIEALLWANDLPTWAQYVEDCHALVLRSHRDGAALFLAPFGGMAALSDVVLFDGDEMSKAKTDRFQALVLQAWNLADQLNRG